MGMALGDWSVVYWKRDPTNVLNPYYAQVFVGLPALPALGQSRRYLNRDNVDANGLDSSLKGSFSGSLRIHDPSTGIPDGEVSGQISLEPGKDAADPAAVQGRFEGTLTTSDGQESQRALALGGIPKVGKPVMADPDRNLEVDVIDRTNDQSRKVGRLRGSIPRSFWDRFEAPPDEAYYLDLHRELGKFHELAMTFTMIAGLLNILVILDAVEGPAYGYGDEPPPSGSPPAPQAAPPDPSTTSAGATSASP